MNLIGTYKIDDLTVVNPLIEVRQVNDNIIDKTCTIEILINVEGALINHSRNIEGFTYMDTWEDLDIINFIAAELEKLKLVNPSSTRISNKTITEENNISTVKTNIKRKLNFIQKIIKWIQTLY